MQGVQTETKNLYATTSYSDIPNTSDIFLNKTCDVQLELVESDNLSVLCKIEDRESEETDVNFRFKDIDRANFPNVLADSIKLRIIQGNPIGPFHGAKTVGQVWVSK